MNHIYYEFYKKINSGVDIHQMNLSVVDYVRVSTSSYNQKKSFNNQIETYRKMIDDTPNWTYVGTYSDEAITGTKAAVRGGFQQMIQDAKTGTFNLILVKDVSRFARNIKECLVYTDELKSYGVMIYFVKENINSFRCSDQIMLQFMALGAEMEAKNARSRTKIVFEQGIANGKVYGNSKILGYKKQNCHLIIDPKESEIVKKIFELYVYQQMGLRRIAKELFNQGLFRNDGTPIAVRTIKTVLENPKYKGFFCGKKTEKIDLGDKYIRKELPPTEWIIYKDPTIPAIISEELWDQAEKIRKAKQFNTHTQNHTPYNQGIYQYSKKIESEFIPGLHYTHYIYKYKNQIREAWQCRNYKSLDHDSTIGPIVYSDELDAIVRDILGFLSNNYRDIIDDLINKYQSISQTNLNTTTSLENPLFESEDFKKTIQKIAQEFIPCKNVVNQLIEKIIVCNNSTNKVVHLKFLIKDSDSSLSFSISR